MAIAKQQSIELPAARPPKSELLELLVESLSDRCRTQRLRGKLTGLEREALETLIAAGGRMPWARYRARFGDIRPHKPWRDDHPTHPWRSPISPAERLAYLGLVYVYPRKPASGQRVDIVIPDELLAVLPAPTAVTDDASLALDAVRRSHPRGDLLRDIALLMSLLHREDIRPLHGRWLAPRHVAALNERLSYPEDLSNVRSELQTRTPPERFTALGRERAVCERIRETLSPQAVLVGNEDIDGLRRARDCR